MNWTLAEARRHAEHALRTWVWVAHHAAQVVTGEAPASVRVELAEVREWMERWQRDLERPTGVTIDDVYGHLGHAWYHVERAAAAVCRWRASADTREIADLESGLLKLLESTTSARAVYHLAIKNGDIPVWGKQAA